MYKNFNSFVCSFSELGDFGLPLILSFNPNTGAWGGVVVKTLRYGRSWDRFPVVSLDFSVTYSFLPYHGPGVDTFPSENEYQKHILGVKAAGV